MYSFVFEANVMALLLLANSTWLMPFTNIMAQCRK